MALLPDRPERLMQLMNQLTLLDGGNRYCRDDQRSHRAVTSYSHGRGGLRGLVGCHSLAHPHCPYLNRQLIWSPQGWVRNWMIEHRRNWDHHLCLNFRRGRHAAKYDIVHIWIMPQKVVLIKIILIIGTFICNRGSGFFSVAVFLLI